MKTWVEDLTFHYESCMRKYPGDKLLIAFDIDGTILDTRPAVFEVLRDFDERHNTRYFENVQVSEITGDETDFHRLLDRLGLTSEEQQTVKVDCEQALRSPEVIIGAHARFQGILDLIRWFQLQPNTYVAIITGRPDSTRLNTLLALGILEKEYSVHFPDDLVIMRPPQSAWKSKADALMYCRQKGYRVFAMIDSDIKNLEAIMCADTEREVLLLPTEKILKPLQRRVLDRSVKTILCDNGLARPDTAPSPATLVWDWTDHTQYGLFRFLSSNIQWIKVDPHFFLPGVSHTHLAHPRGSTPLDLYLGLIKRFEKRLSIDLPEDGLLLGRIMDVISDYNFEDGRLWFNGSEYHRGRHSLNVFDILKRKHPSAILQYPIDSLVSSILEDPDAAKAALGELKSRGVEIFSLSRNTPHKRKILDRLDQWGIPVNLCNADTLKAFMQAVLLRPSSITSAFDFWHSRHSQSSPEGLEAQRPGLSGGLSG